MDRVGFSAIRSVSHSRSESSVIAEGQEVMSTLYGRGVRIGI